MIPRSDARDNRRDSAVRRQTFRRETVIPSAALQARSLIQKRRMAALTPDDADAVEDRDERPPPRILEDAEEEQELRAALADLSERDRELITCLYLGERPMKYTEISRRLGLSI